MKKIDQYFPPRGKCAFCGGDARHRLWDAIKGLNETDEMTARVYNLPLEAVQLVRGMK